MKRMNNFSRHAFGRLEFYTNLLLALLIKWLLEALGILRTTARRERLRAEPGQATLEWVLIGGILVVIVVGLLLTIFKPQIEAIMNNILQMVQNNTSTGATS